MRDHQRERHVGPPLKRLRARRLKLGFSQGEMAVAVGVSKSRYAGLENGNQRPPSLERAAVIAAVLETDVDEIFEVTECGCGCGQPTIGVYLPGHVSRREDHGELVGAAHQRRRAEQGIPETKVCPTCGDTFRRSDVPGQRLEHWVARIYCSMACYQPPVEPRPCARCGTMFKPSQSKDPRRRHCSRSCAALDRWQDRVGVTRAVLRQLPPRARRKWFGRISGELGGAPRQADTDPDFAKKALDVLELRDKNPRLGQRILAERVGLTRWQVRAILATADRASLDA